jgi:hypothetical protein
MRLSACFGGHRVYQALDGCDSHRWGAVHLFDYPQSLEDLRVGIQVFAPEGEV